VLYIHPKAKCTARAQNLSTALEIEIRLIESLLLAAAAPVTTSKRTSVFAYILYRQNMQLKTKETQKSNKRYIIHTRTRAL
jgi:hypothetical protein